MWTGVDPLTRLGFSAKSLWYHRATALLSCRFNQATVASLLWVFEKNTRRNRRGRENEGLCTSLQRIGQNSCFILIFIRAGPFLTSSHMVTCELRVEFGLRVLFSREKLFLSLCTPQRRFSALTVLFCHYSESLSTCQALSSLVKPCQALSSLVKPCQALYSEGVCKPGALQLQARLPTWSMEPLVRHIACPRRNIALYNAYTNLLYK